MEHIKNKYIWIALPYFFTVGILYLWAYWSSFDVNIFEYASLSDLVKVAIIPVGSVFFFILIGFVIGEATTNPIFPEGGGVDSGFTQFLIKTKWLWVWGYWLVLLFLISANFPEKWSVIPFVGMIFPYLILKNTSFLIEVSTDSLRALLIMSSCILPIYSYCQGKINANKIIDGENYRYVESIAGVKNAKFLGHIDQYVFFFSEDNSKIVIQKVTDTAMVLIKKDKL